MRILLSGCARETSILLQALSHAKDHEITQCTDGACAIAELLKNKYDWAIINGHSIAGGESDIARIVRAIGPETQEYPGKSAQAGTNADSTQAHTSCGVEWSKDGILQLHCGLHKLLKNAATPPEVLKTCAGEILFEYHAPCNKGRRHHG